MGITRRAVILKESRGQHPLTPDHSFKSMTAFNTDFNNTELLDQELIIEELEAVAGGGRGKRGGSVAGAGRGLMRESTADFMERMRILESWALE